MRATSYSFQIKKTRQDVFSALLKAKSEFGSKRKIIIDGDGRKLSYHDIVQAAFALGSALNTYTKPGEHVAIMLPTGAPCVLSFFALSVYGRVPAMFNFTAGSRNLKAAGKAAEVKTLITARKFIEIGKLEGLLSELEDDFDILYLEDIKENLSLKDKLAGGLGPLLPDLFRRRQKYEDIGTILFTSGTEGDPKGVVLSHQNILANVEQVRAHLDIFPETDILFNPLPTFHSLGLTIGAILPLIAGVPVVFHPTPLQPREISKRIRKTKPTILLSTDTFISQYARVGEEGDMDSLRLAVCGAERVRDETRMLLRKKFNIEILEGYGATEAAPVVAANAVSRNTPGSVGILMSGMEHKIQPVPGIHKGGRLLVRGPNIMKGYLKASLPGKIEPPKDGWHDTGDIVTVDEEGIIRIKGREKRFAKLGGEMVSLAVVENCASSIWPDHMHVAATIPDPKKGEQIVLLSDTPEANRPDMLAWVQSHGVSELTVPRKVFHVESIPILGTGKVNYGEVSRQALELAGITPKTETDS